MRRRQALRGRIAALLNNGDFAGLAALAGETAGVADELLRLLYAPDELLHWRALEGLGKLAGSHPEQVKKLITRLLYLLNEDSGSFGWGAAAALGEIGRGNLALVADIVPMFCGFLEEKFSRAPMLWGLGRLAEVHPEELGEMVPMIISCLQDADAQVRAMAAWCLGKLGLREAAAALEALRGDESPVTLYDRGELEATTVGRVARKALTALA